MGGGGRQLSTSMFARHLPYALSGPALRVFSLVCKAVCQVVDA